MNTIQLTCENSRTANKEKLNKLARFELNCFFCDSSVSYLVLTKINMVPSIYYGSVFFGLTDQSLNYDCGPNFPKTLRSDITIKTFPST